MLAVDVELDGVLVESYLGSMLQSSTITKMALWVLQPDWSYTFPMPHCSNGDASSEDERKTSS